MLGTECDLRAYDERALMDKEHHVLTHLRNRKPKVVRGHRESFLRFSQPVFLCYRGERDTERRSLKNCNKRAGSRRQNIAVETAA